MENIGSVATDESVIESVRWHDGYSLDVFWSNITRIVAYHENGQLAAQPWVVAYNGDVVVARADLAGAVVRYKRLEERKDA